MIGGGEMVTVDPFWILTLIGGLSSSSAWLLSLIIIRSGIVVDE